MNMLYEAAQCIENPRFSTQRELKLCGWRVKNRKWEQVIHLYFRHSQPIYFHISWQTITQTAKTICARPRKAGII